MPFGSLILPARDLVLFRKWGSSGALEFRGPSIYRPPVNRVPATIGLITDKLFNDFVLECRIRHTRNVLGAKCICLFFNLQNASQYYYVELSESNSAESHNIFRVDGASPVPVIPRRARPVAWDDEQWHTYPN